MENNISDVLTSTIVNAEITVVPSLISNKAFDS